MPVGLKSKRTAFDSPTSIVASDFQLANGKTLSDNEMQTAYHLLDYPGFSHRTLSNKTLPS